MEVIVHYPKSDQDRAELQKRIARIHAQFVLQYVEKLNCPQWQKEQLIDAVADTVSQQSKPGQNEE